MYSKKTLRKQKLAKEELDKEFPDLTYDEKIEMFKSIGLVLAILLIISLLS